MHNSRAYLLSFICLITIAGPAPGSAAEPGDPQRFRDAVQKFESADVVSTPPANAIVFTGSSSIELWHSLNSDMSPLIVINRGIAGSTFEDLIYWINPLVLKYKPRALVVYEGDNDIGESKLTAEEVFEKFKVFASRIHDRLPETRIYALSIKPTILRWALWPEMKRANELIQEWCKDTPEIYYVDVSAPMLDAQKKPRKELFGADGLHMNSQGYDVWASVLKPMLVANDQERDGIVRLLNQSPRALHAPQTAQPATPGKSD